VLAVNREKEEPVKRLLWIAAAAVVLPACIGPIDYLNTVARKGRRAVAEAESVGSVKLSPYEYWSAVTYLHMAREKAAQADFRIANKYGRKAVQMGELAKKQATEKASEGPMATEAPPEESPVVVEPRSPAPEIQQ
jgi:hypothetical protein